MYRESSTSPDVHHDVYGGISISPVCVHDGVYGETDTSPVCVYNGVYGETDTLPVCAYDSIMRRIAFHLSVFVMVWGETSS